MKKNMYANIASLLALMGVIFHMTSSGLKIDKQSQEIKINHIAYNK